MSQEQPKREENHADPREVPSLRLSNCRENGMFY
jgi:hypothetical protein